MKDFIVTLKKILKDELQEAEGYLGCPDGIDEYDDYAIGYLSGVESVVKEVEKCLEKVPQLRTDR